MSPTRTQTSRGFSLVEMLVVITVLAILAALSIPMMNRMQAQSRMVGCQVNLRQIGVALQLYLTEHDNLFPGPLTGAQPVKYRDTMTNAMAMYLAPYLGLPVDGQLRVNQFFLCPVYASQVDTVRTYGITLKDGDYPFGYSKPPNSRAQMTYPAYLVQRQGKETWLLKDIYRSAEGGNAAAPDQPAHGNKANFLMLDGSVQVHPPDYTTE